MNRRDLKKTRQRLARELSAPTQIVRGSLLARRICHQHGYDRCARDEVHRV